MNSPADCHRSGIQGLCFAESLLRETGSAVASHGGEALAVSGLAEPGVAMVPAPLPDSLSAVLDRCFEAVVSVERDGRIAFFNRAAERLFGYRAEEVKGQQIDLLIPERHHGSHGRHIGAFAAAPDDSCVMGGTGQIQGRRKDGSEFVAEGTISKVDVGGRTLFTAMVRDVTLRHEAEQLLRASEEKHRAIVDSAPDAILVADAATGRILEANLAAGELFGCRPEELVGRCQDELHPLHCRDEHRRIFREHLEQGRVRVPDSLILRDDGRELPVAIMARPTTIGGRAVAVGFFRDISDRKRWEGELARARDEAQAASRAKSEFLASMSHELRTPLNGIIGFSEVIRDQLLGPVGLPVYAEYAGDIHTSGQYLLQTIEEILDYSRLEAGKFRLHEEVFAPGEAIADCLRMVRYAADNVGLVLVAEGMESLPRLCADRHAVKQVVANLLSNAIKFTPRGGRVAVRGRLAGDGALEIVVADTGIGIPDSCLPRVFERFEQGRNAPLAERKGTGIGLPLARGLMELHGGSLVLTSEEGSGTVVTARFPAARLRP